MASAIDIQPTPNPSLDLDTTSFDYLAPLITKLQQLPEPLIREVNDFIDFIVIRQERVGNNVRGKNFCEQKLLPRNHFAESLDLSESDSSDYLANLETYEERLARGEIQW